MPINVGDYVEVVDVIWEYNRHMIGKRGWVTKTDITIEDNRAGLRHDAVLTSITTNGRPHMPEHLKKIDPPDWEAVRHVVKEEDGHRSKSP